MANPIYRELIDTALQYGWVSYPKEVVSQHFGIDVTGVDICCVRGNIILALKIDQDPMSQIKDMTDFIYSCSIMREIEKKNMSGNIVKKIWASTKFPNDSMLTAARRKEVEIIHQVNDRLLIGAIVQKLSQQEVIPLQYPQFEVQSMDCS